MQKNRQLFKRKNVKYAHNVLRIETNHYFRGFCLVKVYKNERNNYCVLNN